MQRDKHIPEQSVVPLIPNVMRPKKDCDTDKNIMINMISNLIYKHDIQSINLYIDREEGQPKDDWKTYKTTGYKTITIRLCDKGAF